MGDYTEYEQRELDERDFTDCGNGRRGLLSGCACDACLNVGCDEYHRRREDPYYYGR